MDLWNWFVAPLGVTKITLAWALGLATTVSFMTYHWNETMFKNKEDKELFTLSVGVIIAYLITWGIAWSIHSFM